MWWVVFCFPTVWAVCLFWEAISTSLFMDTETLDKLVLDFDKSNPGVQNLICFLGLLDGVFSVISICVEEKFTRNFRVSREMREKKRVYDSFLDEF